MSQSVDHGVGIGGRTKDSGGGAPGGGGEKGEQDSLKPFRGWGKGLNLP